MSATSEFQNPPMFGDVFSAVSPLKGCVYFKFLINFSAKFRHPFKTHTHTSRFIIIYTHRDAILYVAPVFLRGILVCAD